MDEFGNRPYDQSIHGGVTLIFHLDVVFPFGHKAHCFARRGAFNLMNHQPVSWQFLVQDDRGGSLSFALRGDENPAVVRVRKPEGLAGSRNGRNFEQLRNEIVQFLLWRWRTLGTGGSGQAREKNRDGSKQVCGHNEHRQISERA